MRVLIPAFDYADFLAVTLPAWRRALPAASIAVIIGAVDVRARAIAREASADVVVTDAWHRDGATFDKASALDEGLRAARPGELVLAIDADVYPGARFPVEATCQEGVLYGAPRYDCPTPAQLEAHRTGALAREQLALILPRRRGQERPDLQNGADVALARRVARRGLGYLQCFRYVPGLQFGPAPTAGGYDVRFAKRFPLHAPLPGDFYVLHLGTQDRRNWQGRVVPAWGAA